MTQLRGDQTDALKTMAKDRSTSIAELIRDSVDLFLRGEHDPRGEASLKRALALAGKYTDQTDIAADHDQYLAQAYEGTSDGQDG